MPPDSNTLESISNDVEDYIAQKKVNFKIFKIDAGQEKIIELRYMTATHEEKMIVIPMARIGHVTRSSTGGNKFKIYFGDNDQEGYGFSPVVIFDKRELN